MARTGHDVVLVRHGATEWSENGRHTGTTDLPLSSAGRAQAAAIAPRLRQWEFSLVLSSPLARAQDSARLAGLGDAVTLREDLREWDYGAYEGLTTPQIEERAPGWYLFRDGCPDGERADDIGARVDRVVSELRFAAGDAVVFAHGHVLRVLAARWLGLAPQDGGAFALGTATMSVLGGEHDRAALWLWNDDRHLG